MKKKIELPLTVIASRDEAEAVMSKLAQAVNDHRSMVTERDEQILAVNRDYEPALARYEAEMKSGTDALRLWAGSNPGEFPPDKKSLQLTGGTLGFRTSSPRLALLGRTWTWEKSAGRGAETPAGIRPPPA
jgi:hypothetical protein